MFFRVLKPLMTEVQFSMRLQPGKQILGPFVGPVAGLYPEGRVTQARSLVQLPERSRLILCGAPC